jgi:hypothetical protein
MERDMQIRVQKGTCQVLERNLHKRVERQRLGMERDLRMSGNRTCEKKKHIGVGMKKMHSVGKGTGTNLGHLCVVRTYNTEY